MGVLHIVGDRFGVNETFNQDALGNIALLHDWKNYLIVKFFEAAYSNALNILKETAAYSELLPDDELFLLAV